MNDAFTVFFIFGVLLGLLGAMVFLISKSALIMKKQLAEYERPATQFDSKPEATPGIFLRHFNSPQIAYLRQQRSWIAQCIVGSWLSLMFFCFGLSIGHGELNSYSFAFSFPQRVWYEYLRAGLVWNLAWSAFLAAIFARTASAQQKGIEPRFIRTRPLTLHFLFWSRTGVALTSLLTAIAMAALGFFFMLRMFCGPVWRQGLSVINRPEITKQQAHILMWTLQTSPVRPFLSLLTTTTLVFSLGVAAGSLASRCMLSSNSVLASFVRNYLFSGLFVGLLCLSVSAIEGTSSFRFARVLFVYDTVGPPPSYAFALLPIAIAAALLELARFFDGRREAP